MAKREKGRRGNPPKPVAGTVADIRQLRDYNRATPKFCLHHLQSGFDVENLSRDRRAAFAIALRKRSKLTWQEILTAPRHGLGTEKIPSTAIQAPIPAQYRDAAEFIVLRYDGLRPMVGVRANDVYHVLWIENEFNELYDHGS